MCNAWNHPIECTCGWGGDGHQGKRTAGNSVTNNPWIRYLSFSGSSSYTNPNASCPVCGEPVFFYQSASGGKVFFDELGPPWPKHPCTDNPRGKFPMPEYLFQSEVVRQYAWQNAGWLPFVVKRIIPQPPQFRLFNIRGDVNGVELSLYTTIKGINEKAPFLVKRVDEAQYEVTTIQFFLNSAVASVFNFIGYSSAMIAAHQPVQNVAKGTIHQARNSSSKLKSNPISSLSPPSVVARKSRNSLRKEPASRPVSFGSTRQERSAGGSAEAHSNRSAKRVLYGGDRRSTEPQGALQKALIAAGFKKPD